MPENKSGVFSVSIKGLHFCSPPIFGKVTIANPTYPVVKFSGSPYEDILNAHLKCSHCLAVDSKTLADRLVEQLTGNALGDTRGGMSETESKPESKSLSISDIDAKWPIAKHDTDPDTGTFFPELPTDNVRDARDVSNDDAYCKCHDTNKYVTYGFLQGSICVTCGKQHR